MKRQTLLILFAVCGTFATAEDLKTKGSLSGHSSSQPPEAVGVEIRCFDLVEAALRKFEDRSEKLRPPETMDFGFRPFETVDTGRVTLIDSKRTIEESLPVHALVLKNQELFEFIRTAQADDNSNVRFAPKLTLASGVAAEVVDLTDVRRSEMNPKIRGDSPHLRPDANGIHSVIRATVLPGKTIRTEFRLTQTQPLQREDGQTSTRRERTMTQFAVNLPQNSSVAVWGIPLRRDEPKKPRLLQLTGGQPPRRFMRLIIVTPKALGRAVTAEEMRRKVYE